jgi:hypothetical protein
MTFNLSLSFFSHFSLAGIGRMENAGYFSGCKQHTLYGGRERREIESILWENTRNNGLKAGYCTF